MYIFVLFLLYQVFQEDLSWVCRACLVLDLSCTCFPLSFSCKWFVVKKKKKILNEYCNFPIYFWFGLKCNWNSYSALHLFSSRTFLSIIGGVVAGILGLTGLMGFIFYFLIMAITSIGLAAKAKFSVHSYFDCWNRIILDGFLSGLMVILLSSLFLSF